MSLATYSSPGQRIGRIKGQIWKHAVHVACLESSGEVWKQPVGMGDTVTFRQVVPYGATAAAPNTFTVTAASHLIQEGYTPNVDSLVTLDTSVTVQKYGCLYGYTEKQKSLGEDPIPDWMTEQVGERLGHVREAIYIGALNGCTNRFYSGGTTRVTVDEPVTLNLVNRITRNLKGNHAKFVRDVLKPSSNVGTLAIQPSFIAYSTTLIQADVEAIAGYTAVKDYGSGGMAKIHDYEVGATGAIRWVLSPDIATVIDAGAAIAGTVNQSTTGTSADVALVYVIAKDAWGHCAFRGLDAFKFNHLDVDTADKSDPTAERGYVSATFYDAGVVSNHGWMAVAEVSFSNLT